MNTTQTEAKWLPPGLPEWDLKYSVSGHDILERDRHWREEVFRLRSELARREEAEKTLVKKISDRLRLHWSFDEYQSHTHTWHTKEDFIEWLSALSPSTPSSAGGRG